MKKNLLTCLIFAFSVSQAIAQGIYMEYKMSSDKNVSATMITSTRNGDSRSEITFNSDGKSPAPMMGKTMVTLLLKDKPEVVYLLNAEQKTYTEMDISKKEDAKDYAQEDYEVTLIGKEKVGGYNTVHVKIRNKKTLVEQEMWTTTEIPDFADLVKVKSKYTGKDNLNKALAAKGAGGFPVKILVNEKLGSGTVELVKVEKRNNPASLFSLEGYTKSGAQGGAQSSQQMMEKLKNMSPEERQKYIEELKKQYGK